MIGVAAFAFAAAGCGTAQQESSSPMFWMYIPAPSIDRPRGAPAEVALPRQPCTTDRIQVLVAGEVVSPGAIRPPQGCTVLQAVGYARGFTEFAFTPRLRLRPTGDASRCSTGDRDLDTLLNMPGAMRVEYPGATWFSLMNRCPSTIAPQTERNILK